MDDECKFTKNMKIKGRRKQIATIYGYAEGWDLSNHSFTDLSLSIDPDAIMFIVGWHAIQSTTSIKHDQHPIDSRVW